MRKALLILSIMVVASLFNTTAFAAVANDEVTSIKLKEADGLASQDTNSGSGVKTGHIQNNAVTTGKIADGAVTTIKILDSAVSSSKIANGAVTDAKITGPISASKISSTGLNADTVDGKHAADLAPVVHTHNQSDVNGLTSALAGKANLTHDHDGAYLKKIANIITVAPSGGDFATIQGALDSINPTVDAPYLINVMPGAYNESIAVNNKGNFHIHGAGKGIVKIIGGISITSGANFMISGIGISQGSLTISNADNFTIRDNSLVDGSGSGLGISYSSSGLIEDNAFSSIAFDGISAYRSTLNIRNNTIKGAYEGIVLQIGNFTVSNNTISNVSQSGILNDAAVTVINGNSINNAAYGIQLWGTSNVVRNNIITDNGIGILAGGSGTPVDQISNNTIVGNGTGIWLSGATPIVNFNTIINSWNGTGDIHVDGGLPVIISNTYNTIYTYYEPLTAVGRFNADTNGNVVFP